MDKEKFRQHLALATKFLISFTKNYYYNDFSYSYKFIITSNSPNTDPHLNEKEIAGLKRVNKIQNKLLTEDQVLDLFHQDNKVPAWINIEVYESKPNLTVIKLLCSRRFREDTELNYHADQYPPFHLLIPMPPDEFKVERGGKFDINWKKQLDDSEKRRHIFTKLMKLFKLY